MKMTQFVSEIETWSDHVVPSERRNGAGGTHIYDAVPFDSETIEKSFIKGLEKRKGRETVHQATVLVHGDDAGWENTIRIGQS